MAPLIFSVEFFGQRPDVCLNNFRTGGQRSLTSVDALLSYLFQVVDIVLNSFCIDWYKTLALDKATVK